MAVMPPSAATVITRGLRGRCPACGVGRVFRRTGSGEGRGVVASAPDCEACGWRFERCMGHWVGGNEISLLAAFATGVAAYAAAAAFLGLSPAAAWIATAATGVFSVVSYRRCRAVFFALDYVLDPSPDAACPSPSAALRDDDTDAGGDRDLDRPRDPPRPPLPAMPAAPEPWSPPPPADSSESFIPSPPAPYPPPATVSP